MIDIFISNEIVYRSLNCIEVETKKPLSILLKCHRVFDKRHNDGFSNCFLSNRESGIIKDVKCTKDENLLTR